ncbi:hypothetical protein [Singulisphaera acidiphila]|uniref:Uncharacterized protein n=1 Tax=Singulisphaera acidiphila (strain ATCC BAA-1392 / DSM 18658 / VKM B-2454 / MOB10) TaxID=886293 RepID=L0DJZ4_SINAD|nr:hypothetical protein [Singulisphaera acidiphila]AGA29577.1 hypothetical protein Sinac_5430 [Singulisphaera acidiphila DSM 18658]
MPVSTTAMIVVCLAMALAAGLSALATRSARRRDTAASPWWGALAVGLAYTLGHAGVAIPSIPPSDVTDHILGIALAGAAVAAFLVGERGGLRVRVAGYLGLAALACIVMLGPVLGAGDLPRETIGWLTATAIVSLLAVLNVALLDAPAWRSELWVTLTVFAAGAGVVLVLANSVILFLLGGVLAVVLATSLLASGGQPTGGGVPVAAAVLTALVVEGYVYAFLPTAAALLLAASPATLWLIRLRPLHRLGPKSRATVAAGLVLVPVAIAIGLILASKSFDNYGS